MSNKSNKSNNPPTYDGNYTGQGIYDGSGWYAKSDDGPIIHCFSHERDKPEGPSGGTSHWFESRRAAETFFSRGSNKGGKRKYSLRRRRGRKHKSRRGGKK